MSLSKWLLVAVVCLAWTSAAGVTSAAPVIDWVPVGNAGNAADNTGYGAVSAPYEIMKYEWTNTLYAQFLNAVDPEGLNPNGIWNSSMGTDPRGGISYTSGNAPASKYAARTNMGDKPVNFVSWFDAARVANWLQAGAGTYGTTTSGSAAINGGAYTLGGATTGTAPAKNANARFWLPSQNEWYKAAFYKGSGTNAGYWDFATQSDTAPTAVTATTVGTGTSGGASPVTTGNFANYNNDADWNLQNGNVTTVGSNGGPSAYGTFDMSGNVFEWNGLSAGGSSPHGIMGGGFRGTSPDIDSSYSNTSLPTSIESDQIGFRLAAVPEPSSIAMALAGLACGGWSMLRRRNRRPRSLSVAIAASLVLVAACLCISPAHAVTIDWVTVGTPGNASDPATGNLYGAVNYEYQIGKYEVTIEQYAAFLNNVAATDTYSLYNPNMGDNLNSAGISRSGSSGSYVYAVIGPSGTAPAGASSPGSRPITMVSWFNAARFANWMSNGQPTGAQGPTTTENGAYAISGTSTAPAMNAVNPNTGAIPLYRIPTENEWYKAAFYSPLLNSGSGGYYTYATQSNTAPGNVIGGGANQANYAAAGLYSVTNSATYLLDQNYLTDVGAFTNSASYYGTFDQSGNAWEWNDLTGAAGSTRGLRGGGFPNDTPTNLSSASSATWAPSAQFQPWGFRLAVPVAVPEPSTYAMALAGVACGGWMLRRKSARKRCGTWSSAATLALAATLLSAGSAQAAPITLDWVTVGDPGNVADDTGFGAVTGSFQIMNYEMTNTQYVTFLNAVAATDTYSLYNVNMTTDARGGITRSGTSGGYTYAAKANMGDKPVMHVSWFDAARMANWLQNGQGGAGSTETGAYTLVGGQTSGTAPARNPGATFYIPTENQWYKAAYYKGGGTNAGYWDFATQSDTAPAAVTANSVGVGSAGSSGNSANSSEAAEWNEQVGNVTTVGTNGGPSAYGAFDLSGNVYEWTDADGVPSSLRVLRGGSWDVPAALLTAADARYFDEPTSYENDFSGFRLARPVPVPEPSTWAMALAGLVGGGLMMRRCRSS